MNVPDTALDIAISRIKQSAYLTATAAAVNAFVEERVKSRPLAQVTPNRVNNAGYSGGLGFPTESWVEGWSSSFGYSLDLASQNIGRYLLAAMGGYAVSQPDAVGSPTVYKHVFTPLDRRTTVQLPAFSILNQANPSGNGINSLLPSMVADSFRFDGNAKSRVEGTVVWTGSGEETIPSGVTWATHVNTVQNTLNYFYNPQASLKIGDYPSMGSPTTWTTCDLLRMGFGVTNSHAADDYGCPRYKVSGDLEKGVMRNHYLLQGQSYSLDFLLKLQANNPMHTAMVNQSPLEIEASYTGNLISGTYSHQIKVISYFTKYATVERGFTNGFATVQVTPELLFSNTDNQIVQVELINNVASYIT